MKRLLKLFHKCWYKKPILSRYLSFNSREIVFECRCGKRKLFEVTVSDSDKPFPIQTTPFLTDEDIKQCLTNIQTP